VLPENVKMDLPKAVKAIRNSGLLIDRITTAITDTDDPFTISILTTAAELGIGNYRLGWLSYDASISIKENLQFFNLKLQKLAALNRQLGIKGAYQNHAGDGVGGPVWDMSLLLDGIDPEILGIRYDIRHATVSGGLSWPVGLEYLADKINSIDLKDFVWKEKENKWQPVNVPLGEGMVDFDRFLKILKQKNINGDFTMHFEYELGGADTGTFSLTVPPETVISAMKRDLAVFKGWM
jgi:sugar phosphate isomerase/epimerase